MRTLITVAAALAVLVGSQALGAVSIDYKLELGGDNHADQWKALEYPAYTRAANGDADGKVYDNTAGAILDWAVIVTVSGNDDVSGYAPAGAANLVYDLELRAGTADGPLVAIGHGSPTTAGFFSTINDGVADDLGRPNALNDAAFAVGFNVDGLGAQGGRLIDQVNSGGPFLDFWTYPSDAGHPAASTAPQGKLVGMGAGYKELKNGGPSSSANRVGVGIATGSDMGGVCEPLGILPLFEGQINCKGLPPGIYVLVLKAGVGNNIVPSDTGEFPVCDPGVNGKFAVAAPAVNEDTITFELTGGGQPCVAPVLVAASSVKTHGDKGDFSIDLMAKAVECRTDGITKVVATFDKTVKLMTGTAADVTVSEGTVTGVIAAGSTVTVSLTGVQDKQVTMAFPGVADGSECVGDATSTSTLCMASLYGDVNGDGVNNLSDMLAVRDTLNQTANADNFRGDVYTDGVMNLSDMLVVRDNLNKTVDKCP